MLQQLIHREWRDARVVTFASAVVAVLASVAINVWFVHWKDGPVMAVAIVPALLGLYLAIVASDLVAADVATRRIDALALLPTGMGRVWTAKVIFLAVAGTAFLAGLVAAQLVLLSVAGVPHQVEAFLTALPDALPNLGFVAAGVGAVLFFSTLFDRSFAAVVAGLIVVAAAVYAWRSADWIGWEVDASAQRAALVAVGVAVVFTIGSAVAFVRGPAHGATLRRAVVGLTVPLGVFVPVGVGSAVALDRWMTLTPGDTDCRIMAIHPSPDGKFIAMQMQKNGRWHSQYLWIVRVADGHVVARPESNLRVDDWSADGLLRAWNYRSHGTWHGTFSDDLTLLRWIDPATGGLIRTRSNEQVTAERTAKPPERLPRSLVMNPDGSWVVRETATKVDTPLVEADSARRYTKLSPHARYVSVSGRTGGAVVELAPHRVLWSQTSDWFGAEWVRGFADDRFVLVGANSQPTLLLDLSKTPCTSVEPEPLFKYCNAESIAAAPGGGFFIDRQGDHVDLTDEQCRTIRRVYPPDR